MNYYSAILVKFRQQIRRQQFGARPVIIEREVHAFAVEKHPLALNTKDRDHVALGLSADLDKSVNFRRNREWYSLAVFGHAVSAGDTGFNLRMLAVHGTFAMQRTREHLERLAFLSTEIAEADIELFAAMDTREFIHVIVTVAGQLPQPEPPLWKLSTIPLDGHPVAL